MSLSLKLAAERSEPKSQCKKCGGFNSLDTKGCYYCKNNIDPNKEHDEVFSKLIKICKYLFPSMLILLALSYGVYQNTREIVEFKVFEKRIRWLEMCDDCIETPNFYLETDQGGMFVNEEIYNSVVPGRSYLSVVKGWQNWFSDRKITAVKLEPS